MCPPLHLWWSSAEHRIKQSNCLQNAFCSILRKPHSIVTFYPAVAGKTGKAAGLGAIPGDVAFPCRNVGFKSRNTELRPE